VPSRGQAERITVDEVLDALDDIESQLKMIQMWAQRLQETDNGKGEHE
jgi:hypothetical protein